MSGVTSKVIVYLRPLVACLAAGIAIKIMDDSLDAPWDALIGTRTWAGGLQAGALPYALLSFAIACLADVTWAVTLLWASYAVGMRGDLMRPLALGLTGWQEVALSGAIIGLAGSALALFTSFLAIFLVQGLDDLLDRRLDQAAGLPNWATRWGMVELSLALAITAWILVHLHLAKMVLVLLSYACLALLARFRPAPGGENPVDDCSIAG